MICFIVATVEVLKRIFRQPWLKRFYHRLHNYQQVDGWQYGVRDWLKPKCENPKPIFLLPTSNFPALPNIGFFLTLFVDFYWLSLLPEPLPLLYVFGVELKPIKFPLLFILLDRINLGSGKTGNIADIFQSHPRSKSLFATSIHIKLICKWDYPYLSRNYSNRLFNHDLHKPSMGVETRINKSCDRLNIRM
jgi:hypothetical protein